MKQIICPHCGKVAKEIEVIMKSDRQAQALGFRDIETLVAHYRAEGLAYYQIAEKTGIPHRTICSHIPESAKGFRAKTKKHKLACENNGKNLVAMRVKKYFDHPTSNGKSKKQMSLDAMKATKTKLFGDNK